MSTLVTALPLDSTWSGLASKKVSHGGLVYLGLEDKSGVVQWRNCSENRFKELDANKPTKAVFLSKTNPVKVAPFKAVTANNVPIKSQEVVSVVREEEVGNVAVERLMAAAEKD